MKTPLLKPLLLFISLMFFLAPSRNALDTAVITDLPEKSLHNAVKRRMPDGTSGYVIKDIDYGKNADPYSTDLLLTFDREPEKYIKDDSGKYQIYSASFQFLKDGVGNGCASFYKSGDEVKILASEGLWLGHAGDLSSFNIEFRFKAAEFRGGSLLFSRVGYFSGVKKGIEVKLGRGNITASLYNMFRTPSGELKSVHLSRGGAIRTGEWYHFSISFDRGSGRLSKFVNDVEEDVKYMTQSGGPFSEVYVPLFGLIDSESGAERGTDLPLAVIGKDFCGIMDEFRISYMNYEDLKKSRDIALNKYKGSEYAGRVPYNREGVIISPVKEFPSTGTSVTEFSWEEILNPGTFIWMEVRVSDRYFSGSDSSLKWYRVSHGQRNISSMRGDDGGLLRGRYFQWRAHLVASPEGDNSPVMKKVTVKYSMDRPPLVPVSFEVSETGDGFVILRWKKNVEADFSGYRIYYGTRKGRYDGIISTINGRKINNDMVKGNYVTVKIDNSVVEENRMSDTRGVLVYPTIENTVLYYFAVSAYDSYKEGTPYNHESELSSFIDARPYAGSEIKKP